MAINGAYPEDMHDPEDIDPRLQPKDHQRPGEVPVYRVTNLTREAAHHIPKGAFARMITFKEDLDKAHGESTGQLESSANDFFKRSPMLQNQPRRQTEKR